MDPIKLGNITLTFLASIFSHGTAITQGVATRLLGDMVAKRLASAGYGGAWAEFKRDPGNRSSTEKILQQILNSDPEFRARLEDALRAAMQENGRNYERHGSIHINGPGHAQIGDRGDDIDGTRIATRGGTYNEQTRIFNKNTKKSGSSHVAWFAVVALIVVAILIFKVFSAVYHKLHDVGLSASSTCQEFLNAPQADQLAIIDSLAAQYHKPDYTTPLGEPEVPYYCASNPTITLGQFFVNAQP